MDKIDNNCFKVAFLGDIVLNGQYIAMHKEGKKPFSEISQALEGYKVIGNLECFAKGEFGVNTLKRPRLETDLETLNYVKDFHLDVAFLANNHVFDHLDDGFKKTTNFLKDNNIPSLGASFDKDEYDSPLIIEKNTIKIAVLNYVTHDTNPKQPADTNIHLNYFDEEKVKADIKKVKGKVNHVVLSLHWGGRLEGGLYPDWHQPAQAKRLIDAGADLIIGHHSHTVQPYEVYKGKYIFYSIGNFCFADFEFEGIEHNMPNRRNISMLTMIEFTQNSYVVTNRYYQNYHSFFKPKINYGKKLMLRTLVLKMMMRFKILWQLYYHFFKKIMPVYFFLSNDNISLKEKIAKANIKTLKKTLLK